MLESLDPHLLGAIALNSGLGVAMVWLAARKNMLELRQPPRCLACGVIRHRGTCSCDR